MSDERLRLALALSLLALLWHPIGSDLLRPAFLGLAGMGLLFRRALRHPGLWFGLACLAALRVTLDWPLSDNHAYLLAYWCLGVGFALLGKVPDDALASTGRLLVGLVFGFAFVWKAVLSPDFVSGDFLRFAWLTDPRFEFAALHLAGLSPEVLEANRAFLLGADRAPDALTLTPAFGTLTFGATLWTLAAEGGLAIAFLVPSPRLAGARDALLLAFCVVTYAFAPVAGFAWLLLSMGLAQAPKGPRWPRAYLAVAALVLVYDAEPWTLWL